MAYTDTGHRPNKTSVGGTMLINGLMVAGIIYAVPDIVPDRFDPTKVFFIPKTTPPEPIKPAKPDPKPHAKSAKPASQTQPEDLLKTSQSSGDGAGFMPTGELAGQGTGGILETTIKIEPVFKTAQVNPRFTNALQPVYPPGMIREEREGVVTVRVLIGTDGRVKAVEAVRADETAFLESTRKQALSKWRFLPATRDGTPVESWREMTVRFQLPD